MSYLDVLLGGYKTIQNNGALVAAEPTLNIIGATSIVDDSANKRTTVTLGTGITQLSGDVTAGPGSGSVAATVVKANGASVPAAGALTTGNVLQVSGASALSYGPVNLAGGANYISGTLPAGNQAAQTLGGALSGTTAAAAIVPGTNGQIAVTTGSAFAWTSLIKYDTVHGVLTAGNGGSDTQAAMGPLTGNETSLAALWLLGNTTARTSGNCSMYSDGAALNVNSPTASGAINFVNGGSSNMMRISPVSAALFLDALNTIQFGTGLSATTVGTNKSAATMALQADAATTIQTLSASGTELANLSTPAAGTGPRMFGSSGRFGVVDSDGTIHLL